MLDTLVPDALWAARHDLKMSGAGIWLNCRMTLARLDDGSLLIYSPTPIDDALAAQIEALGEVAYLVAPNLFHHLYLKKAQQRFPRAETWAAPGLAQKRPDLRLDHTLWQESPPFADAFLPLPLRGAPKSNETAFWHAATETLLVTDDLFHILHPHNALSALVFTAMGTRGKLAQSRLTRSMVKDRAAFRASHQRLMELPFTRLVMAHGEVVQGEDTQARTREALRWALQE